jgi:3-oxoadipate enol-lactonase
MSDPVRLVASVDGPSGAPVLVLGNSMGTTRAVWDPQLAALRRHFQVLRFELRGHGRLGERSPTPAGPYTIGAMAEDVLALLDARGLDRVRYCGLSLGAMIGLCLAARAPERIAGLGVCCTSAFLPPASLWQDRAARARSAGLASIAGQVVGRWFTPAFRGAHPEVPAAFEAGLVDDVDPEGYAGCCEAIAAMDQRAELGSITAPTLVVAGADDPATPPWHGAAIASAIPGARLSVVRGAAHLASVSTAGQVTSLLLGHLLSLDGAG